MNPFNDLILWGFHTKQQQLNNIPQDRIRWTYQTESQQIGARRVVITDSKHSMLRRRKGEVTLPFPLKAAMLVKTCSKRTNELNINDEEELTSGAPFASARKVTPSAKWWDLRNERTAKFLTRVEEESDIPAILSDSCRASEIWLSTGTRYLPVATPANMKDFS